MKKNLFSLLFFFLFFVKIWPEESDFISLWQEEIRKVVAKSVLFCAAFNGELEKDPDLVAVYYYDRDLVLYQTKFLSHEVKVPYSLLHKNFVRLLNIGRKNIYVSPLFFIKGDGNFYLVGKHTLFGYVMFLFQMPEKLLPDEPYVIFNPEREVVSYHETQLNELKQIKNLFQSQGKELESPFYSFSMVEGSLPMYLYWKPKKKE